MRKGEVLKTIKKYFGPSTAVAAAIMGNIDVETGGSFDFKQKQYKGGPGRGLFQFDWHKKPYAEYLEEEGLTDSMDTQVRYVAENIYGKKQKVLGQGNAKKLRGIFTSDDPIAISDMFEQKFLNPNEEKAHSDRRRASTMNFLFELTPQQ
jgi:hypothetical protein